MYSNPSTIARKDALQIFSENAFTLQASLPLLNRISTSTLFLCSFVAHYLLWTLRFSSSKKLRFEDQIETFTHFIKGLTFGKLCSVLEDLKDLMILKQSYTDFLPLTINHGIRE